MKRIKYLIFTLLLLFPVLKVNAVNGTINIYASSKSVKIGNTTTVTVYCKSSTNVGTCEYVLSYDSTKLKLVEGDISVLDVAPSATTKQLKRTYKFKVINTGSSKVTVKSYAIRTFDGEDEMKTTVSPVTITGVKETSTSTANYSTNNNLKSLEVSGYKISPTFNKDTLEYKLEVEESVEEININATAEDSKATISGKGKVKLSEGDNKINIDVTSEKGTKKTYTIIVTVKDSSPLSVEANGKTYTIIKRESILTKPNNYESTKVTINDIEVPAFYSSTTLFTLIGLKDSDGNIGLYIYDKDNNTYKPYNEVSFNNIKLLILEPSKSFDKYIKTSVTIGDKEVTCYKVSKDSKYSIIYALNLDTNLTDYYTYEEDENTVQKYTDEVVNLYEKDIKLYKKLILIIGGGALLLGVLALLACTVKTKKKSVKDVVKKSNKLDSNKNNKKDKDNIKDKDDIKDKDKDIKKEDIDKKKKKKKKKNDLSLLDDL